MECAQENLEELSRLKRELRRSDKQLRRLAGQQLRLRERVATLAAPMYSSVRRSDNLSAPLGGYPARQGGSSVQW